MKVVPNILKQQFTPEYAKTHNFSDMCCKEFKHGALVEFEEEFIKRNNIDLCELYLPPYNFKRTGCMFCPFSLNLQEQLDTMKEINPVLYKQANILWKPVYDEYRKLNYRLKKENKQLSIFDILK